MNTFNRTQMPTGLIGLQHLAAKELFERNKINPQYFKVIKTKFLRFKNQTPGTANSDRRTMRKYFKFKMNFPKRPFKLDLNAYDETGASQAHDDEATFIDVAEPGRLVWAVISFSTTNATATNWGLSMMRTNRWRDPHGTD